MKKFILGLVATTAVAAPIALTAGTAFANNNKGGTIHVVATVTADANDPSGPGITVTHDFTGTYDAKTGAFTATGTNAVADGWIYHNTSYPNPEHVTGTFKAGVLTFSADYDNSEYLWTGSAKTDNGKGGSFSKAGSWSTVNSDNQFVYTNAPLIGSVEITDAQGNSKG
jgi:hypothetical protein